MRWLRRIFSKVSRSFSCRGCPYASGFVPEEADSLGFVTFEGTFTPIGPLTEDRLHKIMTAQYGLTPKPVRR